MKDGSLEYGYKKPFSLFEKGLLLDEWRDSTATPEEFPPASDAAESIAFSHKPQFKDAAFLHQKYFVEGLSIAQISRAIFSSKDAVRRGLIEAGIQIREPHLPHNGRESQPAFGRRRIKGTAMEVQVEARVVKAILDLKAKGLGLREIARTLSQIGVPTKARGKGWHPQMVKKDYRKDFRGSPRRLP